MEKQTVFCTGCGCANMNPAGGYAWTARAAWEYAALRGICEGWDDGERTFHVPIDQHALAAAND